MNLMALVLLVGYLLNVCTPLPAFQFENHALCDGIGIRILYICVDDQGNFAEWMSTCTSSAESNDGKVELFFLPLVTVGGE